MKNLFSRRRRGVFNVIAGLLVILLSLFLGEAGANAAASLGLGSSLSTAAGGGTGSGYGTAMIQVEANYPNDVPLTLLLTGAQFKTGGTLVGSSLNVTVPAHTPIGSVISVQYACASPSATVSVKDWISPIAALATSGALPVECGGTPPPPRDSDGDGVPDNHPDLCANTPAGASVNADGCAQSQLDSDNDGVTNDKDKCPGTPAGAKVDSQGCVVVTPPVDSDGDGVPDTQDKCANTPHGVKVDGSGCPVVDKIEPAFSSVTYNPNTGVVTLVPKGIFTHSITVYGSLYAVPDTCEGADPSVYRSCLDQTLINSGSAAIDGTKVVGINVGKAPDCGVYQWDISNVAPPVNLSGDLPGYIAGTIVMQQLCTGPVAVPVCHQDGDKEYSFDLAKISEIVDDQGRAIHRSDIIPPFHYRAHGENRSFAGQNWASLSRNAQERLRDGICPVFASTPTLPVSTPTPHPAPHPVVPVVVSHPAAPSPAVKTATTGQRGGHLGQAALPASVTTAGSSSTLMMAGLIFGSLLTISGLALMSLRPRREK